MSPGFNHIHQIIHLRARERRASRVNLLSDPKDKVSALLNMTSDGTTIVLAPDYLNFIEHLKMKISLRMIYNIVSLGPIVFLASYNPKDN